MANSINFLSTQHRKGTEQQKRDRQWFKWSLFGLGGVIVVLLAAIGSSFFLQYQVGRAKNTAQDLEREILASEEVEKSAVVLAKKVSILKILFDERQDKQQAIEYFSNLFGDNVVLKDITYQASEGILSLRVQAFSVFELERVFALLQQEETTSRYATVATSDLRRDQEGAYAMNLTIDLAKAAETAEK
jgi:hypothetical protein